MKKLVGIAALAACVSVVSATEVKAAGPLYVHWVDYCDCMTIFTGVLGEHANNWIFGTWDWKCDGSAVTLIHGVKAPNFMFGTRPVDASGNPAGFDVTFALEGTGSGSNNADITATFDGVSNVLIAEDIQYFIKKNQPCPGTPGGKPPIFP